jgi:hypothetical protein
MANFKGRTFKGGEKDPSFKGRGAVKNIKKSAIKAADRIVKDTMTGNRRSAKAAMAGGGQDDMGSVFKGHSGFNC